MKDIIRRIKSFCFFEVTILFSIIKKEFKIYYRYPAKIIFSIISPFLWFITSYFLILSFSPDGISKGLKSYVNTENIFIFYFLGYLFSYIISQVLWENGLFLVREIRMGTLESLWITPINKIKLIFYSTFAKLINIVLTLFLILLILVLFFKINIKTLPSIFYIIVLSIFLAYGIGNFISSIVLYFKNANSFIDTFITTTDFLSGSKNTPFAFPGILFYVSITIPLTYYIDLIRHIALNSKLLLPFNIEIIIIIATAFIAPFIGILLFKNFEQRVRKKGSLGYY